MNSYLTTNGDSTLQNTTNAAYKSSISTIEGLTKRALYAFKIEIFARVLEKDAISKEEYDLN
jgi:hypothetical protein